VNYFEEI